MLSRLQTCKFSASAPFLHCFKKFLLRPLRISFCRLSTSFADRFPRWSTAQNHNARWGRRLVVDPAEMIFSSPYISFSSSLSLFQRLDLHFFAFLGDIAKLYRCFHHLDCVFFFFFESFSSLLSSPNSHPPARHTFRSSFGFRRY